MHTRDIAAALESLRRRFSQEGIPSAVIGALALRHYGYLRHPKDIDICFHPRGWTGSMPPLSDRAWCPGDLGSGRACARLDTR